MKALDNISNRKCFVSYGPFNLATNCREVGMHSNDDFERMVLLWEIGFSKEFFRWRFLRSCSMFSRAFTMLMARLTCSGCG